VEPAASQPILSRRVTADPVLTRTSVADATTMNVISAAGVRRGLPVIAADNPARAGHQLPLLVHGNARVSTEPATASDSHPVTPHVGTRRVS
jgi:hypothetical protein